MLEGIEITPLLDTLRLEKISDQEYFSEKYNGYISNSRLSRLDPSRGGSPEEFFNKMKPIYSPSLQTGSAVHELVLQPELFKLTSIDKPTGKIGLIADELYKLDYTPTDEEIIQAATKVDYYKGKLSENMMSKVKVACLPYWANRSDLERSYTGLEELIYLDRRSRETVLNCVTALKNNKSVQKILHPQSLSGGSCISEMEKAILLEIGVNMPNGNSFRLRLKSKLDNYTIDTISNEIAVNDIKTLGRVISDFNINIDRYSYNREIAMYSWLLSQCANAFYNMKNYTIKGNYLVVSTIPNYYTKVVPMTKKMYSEGWKQFTYLLKLAAYYYDKGYRFE